MRYPLFDLLRLFLASEVLFRHLADVSMGAKFFMPILPVPAFVAISGYLILGSLEKRGYAEFWKARARRLLPAFFASMLLVLVLFGLPGVLHSLRMWYTFGIGTKGGPNPPLWTLSAEEFLYGSLCLLYAAGIYKLRKAPGALAIFAGLATLASGIWWPEAHKYVMLASSFTIGTWLYRRGVEGSVARGSLWLAAAAALMAFNVYGWQLAQWGSNWLPVANVAMTASTVCAAFGVIAFGKGKPFLRLKHDLSYGVYIYHSPLNIWLAGFGLSLWLHWTLGLAVTALVAALSYRFVESPFLRRKLAKDEAVVAADGVQSGAVVGGVA